MKSLNTYRQKNTFSIIIFLICVLTFVSSIAAQNAIQFNALYNCPDSSMYNFKVLDCDDKIENKYCNVLLVNTSTPSASFQSEVLKSKITDAFKTGGCTIDGKKLETVKNEPQGKSSKPETKPDNTGKKTGRPPQNETTETQTVTEGCSFDEPAGAVSAASKPGAETFKRVIFERYRDNSNSRKVGITYQTFTLGKSYVNHLTGSGLLYDGAPQGATIYPVKTKFRFCDRHTDSTIRWEYDAQYSCFKDKFGEWVCPSDATKISEPTYLPNK